MGTGNESRARNRRKENGDGESHQIDQAKLPKLKITAFNGTASDWVRFGNMFITQVHNKNVTDEVKIGDLLEMTTRRTSRRLDAQVDDSTHKSTTRRTSRRLDAQVDDSTHKSTTRRTSRRLDAQVDDSTHKSPTRRTSRRLDAQVDDSTHKSTTRRTSRRLDAQVDDLTHKSTTRRTSRRLDQQVDDSTHSNYLKLIRRGVGLVLAKRRSISL
eukprot:gene5738-10992_t